MSRLRHLLRLVAHEARDTRSERQAQARERRRAEVRRVAAELQGKYGHQGLG